MEFLLEMNNNIKDISEYSQDINKFKELIKKWNEEEKHDSKSLDETIKIIQNRSKYQNEIRKIVEEYYREEKRFIKEISKNSIKELNILYFKKKQSEKKIEYYRVLHNNTQNNINSYVGQIKKSIDIESVFGKPEKYYDGEQLENLKEWNFKLKDKNNNEQDLRIEETVYDYFLIYGKKHTLINDFLIQYLSVEIEY